MDYESAYKQALERAKSMMALPDDKAMIEEIFPELAESEDARIRRFLIKCVEQPMGTDFLGNIKKEDVLAWLEKQGEQKFIPSRNNILNVWELGNLWKEHPDEREGLTQLQYIQKYWYEKGDYVQGEQKPVKEHNVCDTCDEQAGCINPCPMKLVEKQKPADKVEPKFKVGDWVVNNKTLNSCHILKVEHGQYICDDCSFPITKENEYHLWTIQDAKDGDVLYYNNLFNHSSGIMIYKKDKSSKYVINKYCSCNEFGFEVESYIVLNDGFVNPATKDQRDLLFTKMEKTGYEWDAEKKELKKIENEIEIPFGSKDSELQEVSYYIPEGFHAEIEGNRVVIKRGEQNPAWSEGDETALGDALWCCKQAASIAKDENDMGNIQYAETWLKSLKDRGLPQPKQGKERYTIYNPEDLVLVKAKDYKPTDKIWSEEDEKMHTATIIALTGFIGNEDKIDWLSHLKDRYTWKPSDEQMEALDDFIYAKYPNIEKYGAAVKSLYQDLKKLKE